MKFKTTAIALAVAGTVAAPVAVQAGADEVYASARIGTWWVKGPNNSNGNGVFESDATNPTPERTSDGEVKSFSSRFGARGETDLGNGLTGFGRYEWDVDEDGADSFAIRHRYVGLKGDFGSVLVGKTYSTWYNFAVGVVDRPWWHAGYAMIDYGSRQDDQLTYAGGADAFAFGATIVMTRDSNQGNPDVWEAGASYTFGNDIVLAGAYKGTNADTGDDNDAYNKKDGTAIGNGSDEDIFALALSGVNLGDFNFAFNVQVQDDDTSETIDVAFNNFYAHVELEQIDEDSPGNFSNGLRRSDDDRDRASYTLGYTQSLGRKTTAYYEASYTDNDGNSDNDRTAVMAVLKYDII